MKLIVGLGNPGAKYEKTRHNTGFMVLEKFLKDFESAKNTVWTKEDKFKSDIARIEWQPLHGKLIQVILAKPKVYMNNSGMVVRLITSYYKLLTSDIWIIHDDIDLPLGSMKIRLGGSAAGHHGVESIIGSLKNDKFWRFRMGVGENRELNDSRKKNVDDFVLGNFIGAEKGRLKELIKRGVKAIETGLEKGLEVAMNRFNTK